LSKSKSTILDDLTQIRKIDKSDMLSICLDEYKHYERAAKLAETFSLNCNQPQTIIVAGMGGSAIGGDLLKDWLKPRIAIPIEVCREYSLPKYANRKTLVLIISYSGETEESLSIFLEAIRRRCTVACISAGGILSEFAEKLDIPLLHIPFGMPPRAALPYLFVPQIVLMENLGLTTSVNSEISEAVKILNQISEENSPDKPLKYNLSKSLAASINGTIPFVYGIGAFQAVAHRFKTQLNENSKVPAKWEAFPELDHNEIVGWEGAQKVAKCCSVILLRDKDEAKGIKERIEATEELLKKSSLKTFDVWSRGEGSLAKMSSLICFGDFVSIYLALIRKIDPTPVKTIGLLKDKIKASGLKEKIIRELQGLVKQ